MGFLQRIWEENKRFLLVVGGGLSLFLLLRSCGVEWIVKAAGEQQKKNQKAEQDVNKLRSKVFQGAPEESKLRQDLDQIETNLRARHLTPPPSKVPAAKGGAAQIQFSEAIDAVWNDLRLKANQKNIKIPEKLGPQDLGVGNKNTDAEYERSAGYLEILARGLHACVDSGMVQVDKPVLVPEEYLEIPENPDVHVVYRRWAVMVSGPYDSFKKVLREFQEKPGGFVQVRVVNLDAKGAGGTTLPRGQLEFVGVFFFREGDAEAAKAEEKEKADKPAPRKPKRNPGSRRGSK